MRSIRSRFITVVLAAIVLSVAIVGFISIYTFVQKTDEDTSIIITYVCENEAQEIDAKLKRIEYATRIVAKNLEGAIDSYEHFANDEEYRADYTERAHDLMLDAVEETPGISAFYYRYNAEIESGDIGFLYSRDATHEDFTATPLTVISDYDPDDVEHVGWYYIPMKNGAPLWMDPYYNQNLDLYMISYIVPMFVDGDFVGVLGMDVNFNSVMDDVAKINPYGTGYAFLCSAEGLVFYHPTLPNGTMLFEDDDEETEVDAAIREGSSGEEAIAYVYQGAEKRLVVRSLDNGMRLATNINAKEMNADRTRLTVMLVLAALIIVVLFATISTIIARRSLKPLDELTSAARHVADGDLDVEILSSDTSEISDLISSYQRTVTRLKDQMAVINELAQHDGLTGLLNKSSLEEAMDALDADIACGKASFALAMFDINDLKTLNDIYGHEKGDLYLKSAANAILAAFEGHSVFRFGGDEFTVVVQVDAGAQESALDAMQRRIEHLQEIVDAANARATQPWERISVAYGCAMFDPENDTSSSEVLARADTLMYENKRLMKGA